jgi:glutathione S-transferase
MLTLHYLENSRAQRILWLLEELGVDYQVKHYYRDKVTMLAPKELKDIHPLGKSPVITDTDTDICIAESSAIVQYLIEKYADGKLMPTKESNDYLKYRELMHYAEGTIMPFLVFTLIFNKIKEAPMPFFIKPIANMIANKTLESFVTPNVSNNLDYLEGLLTHKEWFVGDSMSGADIMLSCPLEAAAVRSKLRITHPNLKSFLDRIHDLPSYKKALDKGLPYNFV